MIELKNKKILVLGASNGIGKHVAIKLTELGAKVIISGRDKERLEDTFSKLLGNNNFSIPFDINNLEQIYSFIKSAKEIDNQKLSGIVYCPAIKPIRPLKSTKPSFLHETMLINLYGFIEVVRCFSDKRISEGGSIVVLSSCASIDGDIGQLAYAAAKGAIDSSVIVLSKELSSKGIRINSIRPGNVTYENMENDIIPLGIQTLTDKMLTGAINFNNLAEQIAFFLSDYSSGITGRAFDVRGYLT